MMTRMTHNKTLRGGTYEADRQHPLSCGLLALLHGHGPLRKESCEFVRAKVPLIHVFDPASYNGFELYLVRRIGKIAEEHHEIARERLNSFLEEEFPISQFPRICVAGDAAAQIAQVARNGFDLIIMPTHAGTFRRMLLGSPTAKVLNDADCPVMTSTHAQTIAPRPLEHREWLCAIGLSEDSERVLRFAHEAAEEAHFNLQIIHVIQATGPNFAHSTGPRRANSI